MGGRRSRSAQQRPQAPLRSSIRSWIRRSIRNPQPVCPSKEQPVCPPEEWRMAARHSSSWAVGLRAASEQERSARVVGARGWEAD
jgi:hypothetical protein